MKIGETFIGRVDGKSIKMPTVEAADELFAVLEKHDPNGVFNGDYYRDEVTAESLAESGDNG